jgi:hypothetical protein
MIVKLHIESLGYSLPDMAKLLHESEPKLREMYPIDVTQEVRKPRLTVLK